MQRVTSRNNPRLREAVRLIASSRDRRKSGRCVLEGEHLIDVYTTRVGAPETLIVVDDRLDDPAIAQLLARVPPSRIVAVPRTVFAEVATLPPDVGVLAVVDRTACGAVSDRREFCLLLEDVQDPGNVGSMLRTAAAAGRRPGAAVEALRVRVVAEGAARRAGRAFPDDARRGRRPRRVGSRRFAPREGRSSRPSSRDAPSLYASDLRGRLALAIGNEGGGLSPALLARADRRVTIPMAAGSESLNAAAAAAVVLFEATRQRSAHAGSAQSR